MPRPVRSAPGLGVSPPFASRARAGVFKSSRVLPSVMSASTDAEIVPPTERACTVCGRRDVWDEATENWVIAHEDGERQVGNPNCIHEWDINGEYNPVAETRAGTD